MFTLLRKNLLQKRNLPHSLEYPSLITSISSNPTAQNSFTISYLMNTCGLSHKKAIFASKTLHFDSFTNPDSILSLFRTYGFPNSHISTIIAYNPELLNTSVDKTLKPKLDFFISKGLYGDDLAKVLCRDNRLLKASLEKKIIPSFEFLKSIVGTDGNVVVMLKRANRILTINYERLVMSKIVILRDHGVPDCNIAKFLVCQPGVFMSSVFRFGEIVEEVKSLGFDPSQYTFLKAVQGLKCMSGLTVKAKFDVYKSWGWSEDEVKWAFRTNPSCLSLSKENIMSTMNYYVNEFGYASWLIAKNPGVLLYSLEKRIIPRCSVIKLLIKNGQLEKDLKFHFLNISEDKFLKKYVTSFEKEVPGLMSKYQGKGTTVL